MANKGTSAGQNVAGLFDQRERTDLDVSLHSETTFQYLNRSARPEMARVREQLEAAFARYPSRPDPASAEGRELRTELRARFRSTRQRQQTEAFWELYLHDSLLHAGCEVVVRGDTPDFDVTFDGTVFHIEATVRGRSEEETAQQQRIDALRDGIDRTKVGQWILEAYFEVESKRSPPVAALRDELEAWIASLDVEAARDKFKENLREAFVNRPSRSFSKDGWTVHARVHPKKPDAKQRTGRQPAIGMWGGAQVFVINNAPPMVDALNAKAKRLRKLTSDAPVILAVLVDRDFSDHDDVTDALFGSEGVQFNRQLDGRVHAPVAFRERNGFWSRDRSGPIEGILAVPGLDPFSISRRQPCLWTNPWRHRSPLRIPDALPWAHCWYDEQGQRQERASSSPAEFFGLPLRWPET